MKIKCFFLLLLSYTCFMLGDEYVHQVTNKANDDINFTLFIDDGNNRHYTMQPARTNKRGKSIPACLPISINEKFCVAGIEARSKQFGYVKKMLPSCQKKKYNIIISKDAQNLLDVTLNAQ